MLANWSVPSRVTARRRASSRIGSRPPAAWPIWPTIASTSGNALPGSVTMRPVGTLVVDTTATVRAASAAVRFFGSAATSRSQPRYRSHSPAAALLAADSGDALILTSETTAPPFWARPIWSSVRTSRLANPAAAARICDTVTIPVPPTPVIRVVCGAASTSNRATGAGRSAALSGAAVRPRPGRADLHERGTVASQAGEVLVAGRLVDCGLAAEVGVNRLDGQAVRLLPAVAAALADPLVDHHGLRGCGGLPALALAAQFSRALLVVDEDSDAGHRTQRLLRLGQPVPGPDLGDARQPTVLPPERPLPVSPGLAGGDDDAAH